PIDLQDEILVFLFGPEVLVLLILGFAERVVIDHAVQDFPVAVVAFRNGPAGEILAVEERDEAVVGFGLFRFLFGAESGERQSDGGREKEDEGAAIHEGWGEAADLRATLLNATKKTREKLQAPNTKL